METLNYKEKEKIKEKALDITTEIYTDKMFGYDEFFDLLMGEIIDQTKEHIDNKKLRKRKGGR